MSDKTVQSKKPKDADNNGLISIAKRLYKLYSPYLGFERKNLRRTLYLAGVVVGNIILAFALGFVSVSMRSLMGLLSVPGVTYAEFFAAAGQSVLSIFIYGSITAVDAVLASKFASSVSHAINKDLEQQWIKSKAYFGSSLLGKKKGDNPSKIISHEVNELNNKASELFDNYLTTISNFVVGVFGLYWLSVPLEFTLMSLSISIPGYLVIGTIIYSLVYNGIISNIGNKLESLHRKRKESESKISSRINHIKTNAEQIAFKKGAETEHKSLLSLIKHNKLSQSAVAKINAFLTFGKNLHAEFTSFVAILLCAPNIINKSLDFSSILEIPYHFQNLVNMFTWKSDNFDELANCSASLTQVENFKNSLKQWDDIQKQNAKQLNLVVSDERLITIDNLTLRDAQGKPILENFSAKFPKSKITLLQGESGVGKTSLLRAIAGMSPFASGRVTGLSMDTHFIPARPYFPEKCKLIDVIMYPREKSATIDERAKVEGLMKDIGLKQTIISELDTIRDWSGPFLSDGEKQRIEIISAIMKQPKVLFMDEATSRVDHDKRTNNKGKIESLLKKHLPETTIIYTDHNPSDNNFCDNEIYLSRQNTSQPNKKQLAV